MVNIFNPKISVHKRTIGESTANEKEVESILSDVGSSRSVKGYWNIKIKISLNKLCLFANRVARNKFIHINFKTSSVKRIVLSEVSSFQ